MSGFFEEVGCFWRGGNIDLDYCWAMAGVGRIWIYASGQSVSALSGGEACEEVLVYESAVVYGVEDQQRDGVVQSELLCGGRRSLSRGAGGVSWQAEGLNVCGGFGEGG